MKQLLFLVIAISITTLLRAQEPLSKSQQEVQQTVIQLFDALSNRDSVGLKLYCTDDIEIYETGAVWNLDTLIGIAIALKTVI
jgi:ketosteroid isomerase-like protein